MKKTRKFPRTDVIDRQLTRAEQKLVTGGAPSDRALDVSQGKSHHHQPQIIALYGVVVDVDSI